MDLINQFIELVDIQATVNISNPAKVFSLTVSDSETITLANGIIVGTKNLGEAEIVRVLRDGAFTKVEIPEVKVGDLVLNHKNELRSVDSIVEDTDALIGIVAPLDTAIGEKGQVLAYSTISNDFTLVDTTTVSGKIHKLVKNRLVDFPKLIEITTVKHLFTDKDYDYAIEIANGEIIRTTKSHKFSVFNVETMGYEFIPADTIDAAKHAMVIS